MRKIIFRVKRIDNGDWIYGSFVMDAREQAAGDENSSAVGYIRCHDPRQGKMVSVEVERETVGQYTGLTDKEGREIYEGDILKFEFEGDSHTYIMFWGNEGAAWRLKPVGIKGSLDAAGWYPEDWEIIGNIFDNPDLME